MDQPVRARLGDALSGRVNALNLVRLGLAVMVILGHTSPLGGFHPDTRAFDSVAVSGFFVISGYLITASRLRLGIAEYLAHRCLRILPAYWVCLVAVAAIAAPLSTSITGDVWHPSSSVSYVLRNIAIVVRQFPVSDTLRDNPFPATWNGSLGTLAYEFAAYVVTAVLLVPPLVRRHLRAALSVTAALAVVAVTLAHGPLHVTTSIYLSFLELGTSFAIGMAYYAWRDRIPRSLGVAVLSAVVLVVLLLQAPQLLVNVGPVPLGYLLLFLGGTRTTICTRTDISYGVYIYAFPVQQLLVAAGAARLGYATTFVLSTAVTVPIAALSWFLVEQPALRLRSRLRRTRPGDAPAVAAAAAGRTS